MIDYNELEIIERDRSLDYFHGFSKISVLTYKNIKFMVISVYDTFSNTEDELIFKKTVFIYKLEDILELKNFESLLFPTILEDLGLTYDALRNTKISIKKDNTFINYIFNEEFITFVSLQEPIKVVKNIQLSEEQHDKELKYMKFKEVLKIPISSLNLLEIEDIKFDSFEEGYREIDEEKTESIKKFILKYKDQEIIIEFISRAFMYYSIEKNKDKKDKIFVERKDKFFGEVYKSELFGLYQYEQQYNDLYTSYLIQTLDYKFSIVMMKSEYIINAYVKI